MWIPPRQIVSSPLQPSPALITTLSNKLVITAYLSEQKTHSDRQRIGGKLHNCVRRHIVFTIGVIGAILTGNSGISSSHLFMNGLLLSQDSMLAVTGRRYLQYCALLSYQGNGRNVWAVEINSNLEQKIGSLTYTHESINETFLSQAGRQRLPNKCLEYRELRKSQMKNTVTVLYGV